VDLPGIGERPVIRRSTAHTLAPWRREAIALAKERGTALLVDEREARRAARPLGIPVVGSLRVLKEAKDRGLIEQIKPILDELIAAGIYISDTLYHAFLHDVGEA
jgi:predicted nucleic acid-binding protein